MIRACWPAPANYSNIGFFYNLYLTQVLLPCVHVMSDFLLLGSIFPWLAPLVSLSASAVVDTHLFASPGHSTSFVFPVVPKAQLVFCLEGHQHQAGVWLLCTSKGTWVHPEPLKLEPVGRQRLLMGAPSVFGSLSSWGRGREGLGEPFWPPLPTVCGIVLLTIPDSTADHPTSPGSLQHMGRAGQHHHIQ